MAISFIGLGLCFCLFGFHALQCTRRQQRYSRAVYNILVVSLEGKKELLGMYLPESEDAMFWLAVLTNLKKSRDTGNANPMCR